MPAVIDLKTKEGIIAEYAVSNSINGVAKKYDVSWSTAKKIIGEAEGEINKLRDEKRNKYIGDAWEVVYIYLNKLMDPKTIKEAKARDCATVVIGMIERIQRQQEINQNYDVLYNNIYNYFSKGLQEEFEGTPLGKAMEDFFEDQMKKKNREMKDSIRQKIKEKSLSLHDEKDIQRDENIKEWKRRELTAIYEEVKQEIIDEVFDDYDI